MDRIDSSLDEIIAAEKKVARKVKQSKKAGGKDKRGQKSARGIVSTGKTKKIERVQEVQKQKMNEGKTCGRTLHLETMINVVPSGSAKYFDVDAPQVRPVNLSYGVDVLPPPKKRIFGTKKVDFLHVQIESS